MLAMTFVLHTRVSEARPKFRARIFALFRHLDVSITKPCERFEEKGRSYPKIVDDPDNLPDLEVMQQSQDGTKYHRQTFAKIPW